MENKDKEEFCRQVRACEKAMYGLAYSIVKNEQDACDVVGESILRAFYSMHTLRNERSFKPWILQIVHNTAVELIRRECNSVDIDTIDEIEAKNSTVTTETKLVLWDAVNQLKCPYRTVVVLYYYEGLSTAQIARIMEASVITVRQHLSRGRRQLREILQKEDFIV